MLVGCTGAAVPGVIGQVDEQVGAVQGGRPCQGRKDGLIADERGQAVLPPFQYLPRRAGHEIADLGHEFAHEGQPPAQGHVFAERHQVGLVVALADDAVGRHQEGAVIVVHLVALPGEIGAADDEGGPGLLNPAADHTGQHFVMMHVKGGGRFGPDHQIGVPFRRLQREFNVFFGGRYLKGRIPLDGLGDIALNDGDFDAGCRHRPFFNLDDAHLSIDESGGDDAQGEPSPRQCRSAVDPVSLPTLVAAPEHDQEQRGIDHHQNERNAVYARDIRHLDQRAKSVLGMAQKTPGKAGQQVAAQVLQSRQEGRQRDRHQQGVLSGIDDYRGPDGRVEGDIGGEQRQDTDGHDHGNVAIGRDGVGDPVKQRQCMGQTGEQSQPETGPGTDVAQGQQQGDVGHAGQKKQAGAGKGRSQGHPGYQGQE